MEEAAVTFLTRHLRRYRATFACIVILSYLPACTGWHVGGPTPTEFVERERPGQVRVTRIDGSTIVLANPTIRGDSLLGTRNGEDIRLPLSDVSSVAVSRVSIGRTLLLIPAGLVILLVAVAIECSGETGWDSMGCP